MPGVRNSQVHYDIAVIGDGAVGKSALTIQFVQNVFCDTYDPTIEDQHRKQVVIDDECALLEILDTAGQEELTALRDQYFHTAEGFLLVFSLCSLKSFEEVQKLYSQVLRAKDSDFVPVVIVGNKCDLISQRTVMNDDIEVFLSTIKDPSVKYIQTSAKQKIKVEDCFHEIVRTIRQFNAPQEVQLPESAHRSHKRRKKIITSCNLL